MIMGGDQILLALGPLWGQLEYRTMPVGAMVLLGLIGAVAFGVLYYRKHALQSSVEEQFRVFRERAVALMDQLDALRKRHRTLPTTDPDFTAPMAGATLALYNDVETELDRLWERWLKVMEIWDETQKRIREGSGLATAPTEEARRLLEGGELDILVRESARCKERLDRLNQGHEQVREELQAAREEHARLRGSIDGGTGVLLPDDPHRREIEAAGSMLDEAERMITADPIGAASLVQRARSSLKAIAHPRETPERRERRSYEPVSIPLFDELAAAAERLRTAVARLRVNDLFRVFVRAWVLIWVVGLIFSMLTPLMPLLIFFAVLFIIFAGAGVFLRVLTSWIWYGIWGSRR
jgi:hypothetical protein